MSCLVWCGSAPIHSLSLRETEASRHWCWFLWNMVSIRPCVCRPSEAICLSSLLPLCVCSLVLGRRPPARTDEDSASLRPARLLLCRPADCPVNHGHVRSRGGLLVCQVCRHCHTPRCLCPVHGLQAVSGRAACYAGLIIAARPPPSSAVVGSGDLQLPGRRGS